MNASVTTALAALAGAAIGGLTSVLASWLTQRMQVRVQWLAQDILLRQELYKEFIEEASKYYIDAPQHDNADIPALVGTTTRHPGSIWTTMVGGVLVHKSKESCSSSSFFYARHFPSSTNRPEEIESYQASHYSGGLSFGRLSLWGLNELR
jgi:hypothetical protein